MEKSTVALYLITLALVGIVAREGMQTKMKKNTKNDADLAPVGRNRKAKRSCDNVDISSPDFARCANELGSGRNVLPANPEDVARKFNRGFVKDAFAPQGAKLVKAPLGRNRKAKRSNTDDARCNNVKISSPDFARCATQVGASKLGNAFPFTDAANTRADRNESRHLSLPTPNGLMFKGKGGEINPFVGKNGSSLGAAVSPSAMGASMEEILKSTRKAVNTTVSSNTGGNLNLLHPLE